VIFAAFENFEMISPLLDYSLYFNMSTLFVPNSLDLALDVSGILSDFFVLGGGDDLSALPLTSQSSAIFHYSIPTTKLAYPEPFIASASLMHSDL
jgi:hypothetical protein